MKRTVFVALVAAALALGFPSAALAAQGDYTIDELSSEVTVETNAMTHVIDRQVVTFDAINAGYIWYLHVPENGESVRIASVRVAPVDDGGTVIGDWMRLQLVDSQPVVQGHNPGDTAAPSVRGTRTQPWYSFNIGDGMVRCWFPVGSDLDMRERARLDDGLGGLGANGSSPSASTTEIESHADQTRYVVEADYTITHRVSVYRDVGELYWRYAHSSLPVDAHDVNLQVMLPAPGDARVEPNVDVMAWGHGPDNGTLDVREDGTVTCHVDIVERGNYAEAHVTFPSWWLTNIAEGSANVFTEQRQAAAIAEEAQWVDASKRGETWDFMVRALFMALALVVISVGVVAVVRFGRSPRSRRALVRAAATLGVVALGAQLFFREPVTTALLAAFTIIVALASLMLPLSDEEAEDDGGADDAGAENANDGKEDGDAGTEGARDAVETGGTGIEDAISSDGVDSADAEGADDTGAVRDERGAVDADAADADHVEK